MTSPVVLYEVAQGVATITLNRPERLNAWTLELHDSYGDRLEQAAADADVRVIVVTGAGRGFCAGADLAIPVSPEALASLRRPMTYQLQIPKPIIAAINGPCAGIGIVWSAIAELRFGLAGTKYSTAFSRLGLVAEHSTSWSLPRLVGQSVAADLLLSGRTFHAEEALALGFLNRLFDTREALMEGAHAYAKDLVDNVSPYAMARIKQQIWSHWDRSLGDALAESNRFMDESLRRPEILEGAKAFVEKRRPAFAPVVAHVQPDFRFE